MYAHGRGLQWGNRRKRSKKLDRGEGGGQIKSKNQLENAEGKRLMEWNEENGWEVLTEANKGTKKGNRPI
jgi:hypothetical protein